MILCIEYMGWNRFFFLDEVTMSHGFVNMYDDNQNDFCLPNQLDKMHTD